MSDRPGSVARDETLVWVGTYAAKGGRGLYPITRAASGEWVAGEPFEGAQNASFGAWSGRHRLHYLVDEQAGTLGAYRMDKQGWSLVGDTPSGGTQPCYVALDAEEKRLAVANYGSGSVALISLHPETGLPGTSQAHRHAGCGPDAERQKGPHAHCAIFDPRQRRLLQVDLGTDEVLAFLLEAGLGKPRCAYRAPPGSGPRHLLFHPAGRAAFLLCELASTVDRLEADGPRFSSRQRLSTLPEQFGGESLGGHLGINAAGDRVYVTNRGHDSIAVFRFDGERLSLLQHVPSGGSSPRHFLLLEDQRLMLVAHEESGNVTALQVEEGGTLRPAGIDISVPGAAFLLPAHQFHMVPSSSRAIGSDAGL